MSEINSEFWDNIKDMPLILRKIQWVSARLGFIAAILGGAFSGGLLVYLLGPLYSWYFFNDWNFIKYHRKTYPILGSFMKICFEWIRYPEYRIISAISLTAPPLNGPDLSLVRVRASWPKNDGSCNGCIQCCIQRACPLLDADRQGCMSYGSFYWSYFNCGRYPETSAQIRYYSCPKWERCDEPAKESLSESIAECETNQPDIIIRVDKQWYIDQ